ncbi:hypothetical protein FCM35_KLT00546 [Carex littledalei]|uniref:Uncharacterized protein n=1 Tax=Carex littledalei TaxID=544730 RepID=A0A833VZJ5_9POAL|nr:hypothetical protein FCM35_KLT00546 [Carex littledalei]
MTNNQAMFVSSNNSEATLVGSKMKRNTGRKSPIECIDDEDARQCKMDRKSWFFRLEFDDVQPGQSLNEQKSSKINEGYKTCEM